MFGPGAVKVTPTGGRGIGAGGFGGAGRRGSVRMLTGSVCCRSRCLSRADILTPGGGSGTGAATCPIRSVLPFHSATCWAIFALRASSVEWSGTGGSGRPWCLVTSSIVTGGSWEDWLGGGFSRRGIFERAMPIAVTSLPAASLISSIPTRRMESS